MALGHVKLFGPVFQRFALKETVKVFHPPDIEGRTVWPYPVLLRAPPVGLPKTIALFGIVETHGIHHEIHYNFRKLGNNRTLNDRRKYYITISTVRLKVKKNTNSHFISV